MDDERDSEQRKSAIDPIFKHMITTLFQGPEINIQTEVEVGLLPLRIDVVIDFQTPEALCTFQGQTPYWHFLNDNILEFKGEGDRLTIEGFYRIVMRCCHYFLERHVSVSELTVTIVCAQTPRKVLSHPEFEFQKIAEGYYLCRNALGLKIYLIAVNQLPMEPMYYSLLLFASSKKKSETIIEEIVKSGQAKYLAYAYRIHPETTRRILSMADKYTRNLEYIAENMGQDLLPFISSEDRVRGLPLEDRIEDLSDEDRRALLQLLASDEGLTPVQRLQGLDAKQRLQGLSLEDRIDGLSDEEREALRQLLDNQGNDP